MSERKSNEQRKKEMAARIWLSYYNDVLFKAGVITEELRNRMAVKIGNYSISTN